ncbi:MAG: hypothetical protein J4F28_09570, partial [Nitrosopumilaceae archaeon]|nr:hypothetical protein [Nitrosopumilaceae archaeon]
MDCDDHTILPDLLSHYEQNAPKLCVVRTPKQGHHILFKQDPSDPPPGDPKYTDGRGRHIDIKSLGYTLLPPSVYTDSNLGRYEYLYKPNAPNITMRWSDAAGVLRSRGFFSPQDREEMMSDTLRGGLGAAGGAGPDTGAGGQSKYNYNDLLEGGFGPGSRRRMQHSLYIKKRIMGSTIEDAQKTVRRMNSKCLPPLPEREVEYNLKSAEHFYQQKRPEFERQQQQQQQPQLQQQQAAAGRGAPLGGGGGGGAGTSGGGGRGRRNLLDMHTCADTIMHETKYIGHPSGEIYYYAGGIWIRGGEHKLRKSCELRWRDNGITHSQIREIEELVRIRTAIIPDGSGEDA